MFQLEHVNSTKFGMHEVLLPVDFVKKWKTTDGFINKNPLVMNKVIFIVLFMGMLQGHHDADKTSTVTELKRRLLKWPNVLALVDSDRMLGIDSERRCTRSTTRKKTRSSRVLNSIWRQSTG